MGSLDEDPVFELVEPKTKPNDDDEPAKTESEEFLDAQDATDRVV